MGGEESCLSPLVGCRRASRALGWDPTGFRPVVPHRPSRSPPRSRSILAQQFRGCGPTRPRRGGVGVGRAASLPLDGEVKRGRAESRLPFSVKLGQEHTHRGEPFFAGNDDARVRLNKMLHQLLDFAGSKAPRADNNLAASLAGDPEVRRGRHVQARLAPSVERS